MPRSPWGLAACALFAALLAVAASPPRRSTLSVVEAERWALGPGSTLRDRTLAEWSRGAPLDDLVWLLRHPPRALGSAEPALLDAALARTDSSRRELRQRLLARRAAHARRPLKKGEHPLPALDALRPWASVFRVTAILPSEGEYASYSRAVRLALAEGLRWGRPAGARALELDTLGTGDSDPARVAAAFEEASERSDILVGELVSVPTLSLATAAGVTGQLLVSPTATDERIASVGPHVFQVGPGPEARARALASVVLGRGAHVAAISGSASGIRGAFAEAFAAEVSRRGGRVVRRDVARSVPSEVTSHARSLRESGADVLLWDGPARDAEALLRALASEAVPLRLCGGPALSPDGMRPKARPLLEGVAWVPDEWRLAPHVRARLDSLASVAGVRGGTLWTQGFLAGQVIASLVDRGALSAEEAELQLQHEATRFGTAGFRIPGPHGATLPVYVVRDGKAVVESPQ